jgi:hypothetical protein
VLGYSGNIGFVTGNDAIQVTANTTAQTVSSFSVANGDQVDLSQILSGHSLTASTLSQYITVADSGSNTILTIAGDSGTDTVTLSGIGALSLQTLINENAFILTSH